MTAIWLCPPQHLLDDWRAELLDKQEVLVRAVDLLAIGSRWRLPQTGGMVTYYHISCLMRTNWCHVQMGYGQESLYPGDMIHTDG
jgi:hypothetical protein